MCIVPDSYEGIGSKAQQLGKRDFPVHLKGSVCSTASHWPKEA